MNMRNGLISLCFLILACTSVVAADSITFNGSSQYATRTLSNSAPFTSVGAWRLDLRITNLGSGDAQGKFFATDHFYIAWTTASNRLDIFIPTGGDFWVYPGAFTGHTTDVTIRLQRDTANSRMTVEMWDSSSATPFFQRTETLSGTGNQNYGNTALGIGNDGSGSNKFGGRIAFARWYNSVVSYPSTSRPTLYANTANLLQYEFENSGNDSSGNSQTLTLTGTPTYNTTPTINPTANAGPDAGGRVAGVTFGLDCSNSSAGDAGPITTYAWTRTAGSGTISSPSSASTNITGIGSGQSTFQCEVGDGTNTDTDSLDVGVVALNADGTVEISDPDIALIIGPILPYNSTGSQVMPYYDANQEESYAIKRNLPSVAPRVDPVGTLSVTNGSPTVTGSSTKFLTQVAQQSPGGVDIPLRISGVSYIVSTVTNDTTLTLTTNYTGSTTSGITDWDQDSGAEASDLYVGYWNYYDAALGAYTAYYRTGLTRWLTEADRLAEAWWSQAAFDYGAKAVDSSEAARQAAMGGLMIRAIRGKTEYWDFINRWLDYQFRSVWVTPRLNYPSLYFGLRDGGYALLYAVWLSQVLPDTFPEYANGTLAAQTGTETDGDDLRADWFDDSINGAVNYYVRLQRADGSWRWNVDEETTLASTIDSDDTSISLTNGTQFRTTATCTDNLPTYPCDVRIDNEYIKYTTRSGNTISGVTRGAYGTTAASHTAGTLVIDVNMGFFEQVFHDGVGVLHALRDLLRITEGNATYATEYNAMRQTILLNMAEGMLMGYDNSPVGDTPAVNARRMAYAIHSWGDWGTARDGMPNTVPAWPTIADLPDARQNVVTWTHSMGAAYHYSGVPWYRDQLDELLSANFGKTGYAGSIGTSDTYYALQDYFSPSNNRRQKEHNEWYRAIGYAFATRLIAPNVPANLPPFVSIDGGDRILANGAGGPSFTARGVDPEGGSVTYAWSTAAGCSVTLSGTTTATVTVTSTPADNLVCSLKVVVTDAAGNSTPQWVAFRLKPAANWAEDRPPVASVPSQNVSLSAGTTSAATALDLSGSTAFGGRTFKCRWVQVSGTDAATISDQKSCNPTVSSLTIGDYVFFGWVYDNLTRGVVPEPGTDGIFVRVSVASAGAGVPKISVSGKVSGSGKIVW
jgi:hypothetical protein